MLSASQHLDDVGTTEFPDEQRDEPTTTTNAEGSSNVLQEVPLAERETSAVNRSKVLVYVVLVISAISVGTAAYFVLSRDEENVFEAEFLRLAEEVMDLTESNANGAFIAAESLSVALTSYALDSNKTWPNVTLPHFELRGEESQKLSKSDLIAFSPIVETAQRVGWEEYSIKNQDWLDESLELRGLGAIDPGPISERIFVSSNGDDALFGAGGIHVPLWQMEHAPTNSSVIMQDLNSVEWFHRLVNTVVDIGHVLISGIQDVEFMLQYSREAVKEEQHAYSLIVDPVFEDFSDDSKVAGLIISILQWEVYFADILPEGSESLIVDVKDSCGSEFTYKIDGHTAKYFGEGDLHDPKYDHLVQTHEFAEFARYDGDDAGNTIHCNYTLKIYPTDELYRDHTSNKPVLYAFMIVLVFAFTAFTFVVYDFLVQRRQLRVLSTAKRTAAIVSSVFPKEVRDRVMQDAENTPKGHSKIGVGRSQRKNVNNFLAEDHEVHTGGSPQRSAPIADLFPQVTIMFANIVGFTAWSSTRDPAQVFTLLETVFREFDSLAKQRRVFKVETVGDCYVAAVGLPQARKDHQTVMARFAGDCLQKMRIVVKDLEMSLGPDTADLGLRIGLHSGPVTAGVLRGERARFQLFGDTMNTCARIETTGGHNQIHVSQETAELLQASGKGHWVHRRTDKVVAKGKGEISTFWLELHSDMGLEDGRSSSSTDKVNELRVQEQKLNSIQPTRPVAQPVEPTNMMDDKVHRLINWNTEILIKLLTDVEARRKATQTRSDPEAMLRCFEGVALHKHRIVLEETRDVIALPRYDKKVAKNQRKLSGTQLSNDVLEQLRDFVQKIASLYRTNAFHNLEHATHVTMSVVKLLGRVVAPDMIEEKSTSKDLHDHTYGITSDPLTQFTVIFSALIHDVDHPGISNVQMVKEHSSTAVAYKNRSVAEQNSVDIAWKLLMEPSYKALRRAIYSTTEEFQRFRQLLVNTVMATDILDKDLHRRRQERWEKAFNIEPIEDDSEDGIEKAINRKATIVIEHLIQASDIAHTMQHWHVYCKWNSRLFEETYRAFKNGRAERDPCELWFESEIRFFDELVIPLAQRLKDCGVFGVSSDEYLTYAIQNRKQWLSQGRQVVAEMVQRIKRESKPRTIRPEQAIGPESP